MFSMESDRNCISPLCEYQHNIKGEETREGGGGGGGGGGGVTELVDPYPRNRRNRKIRTDKPTQGNESDKNNINNRKRGVMNWMAVSHWQNLTIQVT